MFEWVLDTSLHSYSRKKKSINEKNPAEEKSVGPFLHILLFLYPMKISENHEFFWCFQGVIKCDTEKKLLNISSFLGKATFPIKFYLKYYFYLK